MHPSGPASGLLTSPTRKASMEVHKDSSLKPAWAGKPAAVCFVMKVKARGSPFPKRQKCSVFQAVCSAGPTRGCPCPVGWHWAARILGPFCYCHDQGQVVQCFLSWLRVEGQLPIPSALELKLPVSWPSPHYSVVVCLFLGSGLEPTEQWPWYRRQGVTAALVSP